jgi:outer membrane immunogenic protein
VFAPYPNDPAHGTGVGTPDWGFAIQNDWLATVRGRLGVTAGSVLLYGTGGVAFGGFSLGHTVVGYPDPSGRGGNRNETQTGWAAGAGAEWAISRNWSAKAEYLYYSFQDVGGTFTPDAKYGPATDGFNGDFNIQSVRMGINYKFN